ncbi:MAG TPA: hypothetical protein VGK89_01180 [Candidatus Eisenbacteria bacterium]
MKPARTCPADMAAALPETLRIIQTVHDTVRDTIIRVAARERHEPPTWVLTTITAVAAVVAGVLAQWFRVLLDDNRERERIRRVLMTEVAVLGVYLEGIESTAQTQSVRGPDFWREMDNATRGYDELHTKLPLLPRGVDVMTAAWFLNVKRIKLQAETLNIDRTSEADAIRRDEGVRRTYEARYADLKRNAAHERAQGDELYEALFGAIPANWLQRVGAGIWQRHRSPDEARKDAERRGVLPKRDADEQNANPPKRVTP